MTSYTKILLSINFLGLFIGLCEFSEGALPFGIFPFLTSGWYYKPSPTESVVLGLILIKVLSIRLASATGFLPIPYHLNDLFLRSLGKRSIQSHSFTSNHTVTHPHRTFTMKKKFHKIDKNEIVAIERILLSLRRIDSSDCFIRTVCELNQDFLSGKASHDEEQYLKVFRLRKIADIKSTGNWSIWDTYENAIKPEITNCSKKYPSCPLSKKELEFEALLTGIY